MFAITQSQNAKPVTHEVQKITTLIMHSAEKDPPPQRVDDAQTTQNRS